MAVTDELDYPFFEKPATAEAPSGSADFVDSNKRRMPVLTNVLLNADYFST
jgi:hypothetical protein